MRDNIAAFGGDARNVTIAGTSAGGNSVSFHMVSRGSAGLFRRAIMQSGFTGSRLRSAAELETQGEAMARALGCLDPVSVPACLRTKTMEQALAALPSGGRHEFSERPRTDWTPGVDGLEIADQPLALYERGAFTRVPLLLGANGEEGWPYVDRSFPAGLTEAEYAAAVAREFGDEASAVLERYPAAHYATPKDALAKLAGDFEMVCEARRVARHVQKTGTPVYLYSFEHQVATIDGGRSGMTVWPRFVSLGGGGAESDRYLVLDTTTGEGSFVRDEYCNFWDHYFFRSIVGAVPASQP